MGEGRARRRWTSYPWGNSADAQNANLGQGGLAGELRPAGDAGKDVSPWGVLNMGGNVAEFVDQLQMPSATALEKFSSLVKNPPLTSNEPWYTFRGGAYDLGLDNALTYEWASVPGEVPRPGSWIPLRAERASRRASRWALNGYRTPLKKQTNRPNPRSR